MVMPSQQRGLTFIELLVALAISSMLLMVGAPLSNGWVDSSNVRQANHRLLEGMARAKALALNNTGLVSGTIPAAYLVWDGANLCVYGSTAPAALSCDSTASWAASVTATMQLNGASPQCVALNNRAWAVVASIHGTACGTSLTYYISRGAERYPTTGTYVLY